MQEKIREIAARAREFRELSEISVKELADRLHIPEASLAAFENGDGDISASALNEMAQIFQVDLALLLTGEAPRMSVFTVTRAGKGVTVERRKEYQYQSLAANFIGKRGEPFLVTAPPQPEGAPLAKNAHPGQEMDFVLEGELKVVIHDNTVVLRPGDTIYFNSEHPHGMAAVGDRPAKFIAVIL